MHKRGQVTIFIVIAIVIIGFAVLFFSLQTDLIKQPLSPDTERIYNFVQTCIEDVGIDVIYEIGRNGGYYFPPNLSTDSGISYYFFEGQNHIPSKEKIEEEISFFLSEKLFFCTRNFVDFPDLEISQEEIRSRTIIENNKITLNVDYPIIISKDNSTSIIQDFKIEIPVGLGIVYDSVAEFMQQQENNQNICLSCLLGISEKNDLYVDMMDYDEQTTIFLFTDRNSVIKDEEFVWIFANKYGIG